MDKTSVRWHSQLNGRKLWRFNILSLVIRLCNRRRISSGTINMINSISPLFLISNTLNWQNGHQYSTVQYNTLSRARTVVAKLTSHTIFQYNIFAIDDTYNTWTNIIVKMTILRLLGSSDDKEKIGIARPEKI